MAPVSIALIGADGQLGTDLALRIPPESLRPLYYPEFDVTRSEAAEAALRAIRPDVVINTAAFNRVDEAEDRVEEAFKVNALALRGLARVCRGLGAVLVHFSTDYVFDGGKGSPYTEDDAPAPLNAYGTSKLAGEHFVRALCERHFVIRTCGLYGRAGCLDKGRNFVQAMLEEAGRGRPLRVVDDQTMTPTPTAELADNVLALLRSEAYGLYHMTGEGACTWYEFAAAVFALSGVKADLSPVSSAELRQKARRPSYSVLENVRAGRLPLPGFSDWRSALARFLKKA
jgi:dTDP-4-dehydrorhamnose reductase